MSKNKNIGNLFKDKLEGRQFEMKAAYWKNMESMLNATASSNSKKGLWWFSSIFIVLVFSGFISYLFISNKNSNTLNVYQHPIELKEIKSIKDKDIEKENSINYIQKTYSDSKKNSESIGSNLTNEKNNIEGSSVNHFTKKSSHSNISLTNNFSSTNQSVNKNNNNANSSILKSDNPSTNKPLEIESNYKTSTPKSNIEKTSLKSIELESSLIKMNFLSFLLTNEVNETPDSIAELRNYKNAFKTFSPWGISIFSGLNSVKSILEFKNGPTDNAEFLIQKENTKILSNYGVEINYHLNHFNLTSGINITQFGENTNYSFTNETKTIKDNSYWEIKNNSYYEYYEIGLWELDYVFSEGYWQLDSVNFILSRDSSFVYDIDSTYISKIDTTINKTILDDNSTENIYTYIEVPFMIGYEFAVNRWKISPKGGLSLNYLTFVEGTVFNENRFVNLKPEHKSRTNINLLARLNIAYSITKNWSFYLEPNYKLQTLSISKDKNVSQKYKAKGINIGINYRF